MKGKIKRALKQWVSVPYFKYPEITENITVDKKWLIVKIEVKLKMIY